MRAVFVVVALSATTACGSTEPPTTSPTTSPPAAAGDPTGTWVMVSGPAEPIPGWDVTVTIEGDSIGGTAACNGYGGTAEWGDGSITVGELSGTEMGCEPAVQELEQAFLASLATVTSYTAADDRLELVAPDGTWVFEPVAEVPTADLVGTTWVLDGYIDGDVISNEAGMERAFIELAADGALTGATNCRTLSGTWTESGAEVRFDTFGAEGDCPAGAAADLDGRIIAVLGDGFRAEVDGDRLTVSSQGDVGLTFRVG